MYFFLKKGIFFPIITSTRLFELKIFSHSNKCGMYSLLPSFCLILFKLLTQVFVAFSKWFFSRVLSDATTRNFFLIVNCYHRVFLYVSIGSDKSRHLFSVSVRSDKYQINKCYFGVYNLLSSSQRILGAETFLKCLQIWSGITPELLS